MAIWTSCFRILSSFWNVRLTFSDLWVVRTLFCVSCLYLECGLRSRILSACGEYSFQVPVSKTEMIWKILRVDCANVGDESIEQVDFLRSYCDAVIPGAVGDEKTKFRCVTFMVFLQTDGTTFLKIAIAICHIFTLENGANLKYWFKGSGLGVQKGTDGISSPGSSPSGVCHQRPSPKWF